MFRHLPSVVTLLKKHGRGALMPLSKEWGSSANPSEYYNPDIAVCDAAQMTRCIRPEGV